MTMSTLPSLAKTYQGLFDVGVAINPQWLARFPELIARQFNSITPENAMKMEFTQPREGEFDFTDADMMVRFARQHHMRVRGHTLCWHYALPAWVFAGKDGRQADANTMWRRLETHVTTQVEHFRGQVYAWDVINEAIADEPGTVLRDSCWLRALGPSYFPKLFEFAHQADPEALLFYNDYNIVYPEKRDRLAGYLRQLLDDGVPIHGVGIQSHMTLLAPHQIDEPAQDYGGLLAEAIECFADLGLLVHLTELDMSCYPYQNLHAPVIPSPTDELLELQAQRYEAVFRTCAQLSGKVTSVTTWGVTDDLTWLNHFPVAGRTNWPLLFDGEGNPKPAFWRVINAREALVR